MKRALVINIARMGDLIHSTPLLQGLRDNGWEVTLLYSDGFTSIAPLLAGPHHLIPIRLADVVAPLLVLHGPLAASYKELSDLIARLREPRFDLAVNITHTRYSSGLMKLIGARESLGLTLDKRGARKVNGAWANYYFNSILNRGFNRFNLVDLHRLTGGVSRSYPVKLNLPSSVISQKIGAAPRRLTVPVDWITVDKRDAYPTRPQLPSSVIECGTTDSQLSTLNSQLLIGLVPGASTPEKRWPVESFAEAVKIASRSIKLTPVILGGPDESVLTDRLAELIPSAINLGGKTDIPTLAAVIAKFDLLVSNDTGPIHLAASVGTKVVDITLGSARAAESAPYGSSHLVVEPRIGCFPCQPSLRCSHLSCHRHISPDLVARLIVSALSDSGDLETDPTDSATALIYRSDFDDDGFFELQPLNRPPVTLSEVVHLAYRELWKWALADERKPVETTRDSIAALGSRMQERYGSPGDPLDVQPLIEALANLSALAKKGEAAAMQISQVGKDPRKVSEVKSLGKTLTELDEKIARLAYGRPELMPLVAQFTYAKQSIDSADLMVLAAETASACTDLRQWTYLITVWIPSLISNLSQLSTLNFEHTHPTA